MTRKNQEAKINQIGIMQGRLSSADLHRVQRFPWLSWESEFGRARSLGLDCIEWLFEAEDYERNPIWTEAGLDRIRHLMAIFGVGVPSVCATYFMEHPFFRVSYSEQAASVEVLKRLIQQAGRINAKTILIPVLEVAEIRTNAEADRLEMALRACLPVAHNHGVNLALETELPADRYLSLIERFGDPFVGAYFDIGNAAAKGYDPARDIRVLNTTIRGIHIKDRKLNGPNVLLGEGDADFRSCFSALRQVNYRGPLIMETDSRGNCMGLAAANRLFIHGNWAKEKRPAAC